jgi:hypothetical protein
MSTYSVHRQVTGSSHPFNGGLGSYCWGLVPWVPWVTSYSPKIWIRPVFSDGKWLGNLAPRIEDSLTTLD